MLRLQLITSKATQIAWLCIAGWKRPLPMASSQCWVVQKWDPYSLTSAFSAAFDALLCLWNRRTWGHLNLLQACIKIYMMPQRTRSEPTFPWVFFHLPLFPHSSSLSFSSPLSLFFLHLHSLFCGSFLLFGPHWCSEMQDWHWATTEQQIY